jgi:hypothetical protein
MHGFTAIQMMRHQDDRAARAAQAAALHAAAARAGCVRASGVRGVLGGCRRPGASR